MTVTPGQLTPEEQRITGVTLAYLHRCTTKGSALFSEMLTAPRAGSVAESSLRDKDLMEPIYLAGMYLHVALDHYLTLRSMFIPAEVPEGAPAAELRNYSPYTIVRGAFEADAWASWLLDSEVDPTQRLARALTLRAENLRDLLHLGEIDNYEPRANRLVEIATLHGLSARRNRDGEVIDVGVRRPLITALLDDLLPMATPDTKGHPLGSHTYGLLSARAHGNPWAVLHNARAKGLIGPYAAVAEVMIDVVELMRLLSVSLRLHSEAMSRAAILNGQGPADWEKLRGPTAESTLGQ